MVLEEEQFARFWNSVPSEANYEIRRLVRAGTKQIDDELRILAEDDDVDEEYKVILLCLLTELGRLDPSKKKNDKDDVTEDKKRSKALKKRKDTKNISRHDGDCNGAEEVNDPQYELFLKHLKEHEKSYVLEYEKDGLPVVIKYEENTASDEKGDPKPKPKRKLSSAHNEVNGKILEKPDQRMLIRALKHKRGSSNQTRGKVNQHKRDPQSFSIKKTSNGDKLENIDGPRDVKLGGDQNVVNEKINDLKQEDGKKLVIFMKQKGRSSDQTHGVQNQQRTLVKKTKDLACGKSSNLEKEGESKSDSDVEILDESAYQKQEILGPFVPSKIFSKSVRRQMMEEDGVNHIAGSSASDVFREGVLKVLRKPYDREEYTTHLKAVRDGRYLNYYPDLGAKLKKNQYNWRKRLTILRGFFFWLQNLTQGGAFKPWNDRACLAVEPPSPKNLPN